MAQIIPFVPSGQDAPEASEEEVYGYENDPYAAQTMFWDYRQGQDLGGAVGAVAKTNEGTPWAAIVEGAVGLATVGIGAGMAASQAKKKREHEAQMVKEQQKLAEQQAKLAALTGGNSDSDGGFPWGWVIGGTAAVAALGGGVWWYMNREED